MTGTWMDEAGEQDDERKGAGKGVEGTEKSVWS